MIDPKELRIGNYVNCIGYLQIVTKIDPKLITYKEVRPVVKLVNPPNLDLHPIPLTHEILLKTGFQYDETDQEYTIGSIDFGASEEDRYFILWSENIRDFECYFSDTQIKSVHKLQNLYFALTGEELEIKF